MNKSPRFRGFATATVLLGTVAAVSLSACAADPSTAPSKPRATPVTNHCKPQETVRFSCELQDHRLLSMCASPELSTFAGLPKDNPGYAYLVVGTPEGTVQYSYPPNPYDYKKHFYKGTSAHVIPFLFVASEKGQFFFFSERDVSEPIDGVGRWTPENLPEGWSIGIKDKQRACTRLLEFNNHLGAGVMHESAWWDQERERGEAEKAKAKQP